MKVQHSPFPIPSLAVGVTPSLWGRVFIMGGPGSGKTTLGRTIAQAIDGLLCELDAIGYAGGAGAERTLDERLRSVAEIAGQDQWVAEGSYIEWTDVIALSADGIVVLDLPWRVARHRIVLRHVKASLKRSNKHAGIRKLWNSLRDCKRHYLGPAARRQQPDQHDEGNENETARPEPLRFVLFDNCCDPWRIYSTLG